LFKAFRGFPSTHMEQTLRALGEILLKAIPTFILVFVLYLYLARVFFRPLQQVLQKRHEATEGARKLAGESMEKAAAKTAEYEAALRAARGEIYRELDQWRRELQTERATAMDQARREADARIGEAKEELAGEVANLKRTLAGESDALAAQIADSILRRRVA
jgi:F-type H+-transporting ATPase subunit b